MTSFSSNSVYSGQPPGYSPYAGSTGGGGILNLLRQLLAAQQPGTIPSAGGGLFNHTANMQASIYQQQQQMFMREMTQQNMFNQLTGSTLTPVAQGFGRAMGLTFSQRESLQRDALEFSDIMNNSPIGPVLGMLGINMNPSLFNGLNGFGAPEARRFMTTMGGMSNVSASSMEEFYSSFSRATFNPLSEYGSMESMGFNDRSMGFTIGQQGNLAATAAQRGLFRTRDFANRVDFNHLSEQNVNDLADVYSMVNPNGDDSLFRSKLLAGDASAIRQAQDAMASRAGTLMSDQSQGMLSAFASVQQTFGINRDDAGRTIDAIESITGGGIGRLTPEEIRTRMGVFDQLVESTNITAESLKTFLEGVSAIAERNGLNTTVAVEMATMDVAGGVAVAQAGRNRMVDGANGLMVTNRGVLSDTMTRMSMSAQNSQLGRVMGLIGALNITEDDTTDPLLQAAARMQAGTATAEDRQLVAEKGTTSNIVRAVKAIDDFSQTDALDIQMLIEDPNNLNGNVTAAAAQQVRLTQFDQMFDQNANRLSDLTSGIRGINRKQMMLMAASATTARDSASFLSTLHENGVSMDIIEQLSGDEQLLNRVQVGLRSANVFENEKKASLFINEGARAQGASLAHAGGFARSVIAETLGDTPDAQKLEQFLSGIDPENLESSIVKSANKVGNISVRDVFNKLGSQDSTNRKGGLVYELARAEGDERNALIDQISAIAVAGGADDLEVTRRLDSAMRGGDNGDAEMNAISDVIMNMAETLEDPQPTDGNTESGTMGTVGVLGEQDRKSLQDIRDVMVNSELSVKVSNSGQLIIGKAE